MVEDEGPIIEAWSEKVAAEAMKAEQRHSAAISISLELPPAEFNSSR